MARTKSIVCLILCAAVIFTLAACGQTYEKKETQTDLVSKQDQEEKEVETSPLVNNQPEPVKEGELYAVYNHTLFIGDSRIEGFRLHSGVSNASYFCAKSLTVDKIVDGEAVSFDGQKITVLDALSAADYEKIIISVGLNELGWNHIEDFIREYESLIAIVKEQQPDAAVYVQALLPVTAEKSQKHAYVNNAQIYWYNIHIVEMAEKLGIKYVNAASAVVDEHGNLAAGAATDGVHLNKEYCQKWAEYLAGIL